MTTRRNAISSGAEASPYGHRRPEHLVDIIGSENTTAPRLHARIYFLSNRMVVSAHCGSNDLEQIQPHRDRSLFL